MSTTKIVVKNHGPSKSKATYVSFQGFETVDVNKITPSVGSFINPVWTIGELAVGAEVEIEIDAVPRLGSISNTITAKCYSSTKDANLSNNTVSFEVTAGGMGGCPVKLDLGDTGHIQFSVKTVSASQMVYNDGYHYMFAHNIDGIDNVGDFVSDEIPPALDSFNIVAEFYGEDDYSYVEASSEIEGSDVLTIVRFPDTPEHYAETFSYAYSDSPQPLIHEKYLDKTLCITSMAGFYDSDPFYVIPYPVVKTIDSFNMAVPIKTAPYGVYADTVDQITDFFSRTGDEIGGDTMVILSYKKGGETIGELNYEMPDVEEFHVLVSRKPDTVDEWYVMFGIKLSDDNNLPAYNDVVLELFALGEFGDGWWQVLYERSNGYFTAYSDTHVSHDMFNMDSTVAFWSRGQM